MKELQNRNHADYGRPYERCLMYGAGVLSDAELLAVILRTGSRNQDATELAGKILRLSQDGRGLASLCRLTVEELTQLPGVGDVKAIQVQCVGELSKRIAMTSAKPSRAFQTPSAIADYYMEQLRHEEREHVVCMMLDVRGGMIGDEWLTCGTAECSLLTPRDIFAAAMRVRAVSVVLIHNHPSGDPTPSAADILTTERVRQAGELLDIRLTDHIIIGDRCYHSFSENGLMEAGSCYV